MIADNAHKARKAYPCDAFGVWQKYGPTDTVLPPEERAIVEAARADDGQIKAGQTYRCVKFRGENGIETYRARPDVEALCLKYKLMRVV